MDKNIWIDNFIITDTAILAYTLVDDEEIEFNINQDDFETWGDNNEMRKWHYYRFDPITQECYDEPGSDTWPEIYNSRETMTKFLRLYIQSLYDQESFDIVTAIKNIAL